MKGTVRFSVVQSLVALSVEIGASLSNVVGGYVVEFAGYPAGFLFLAATALAAFVFFALAISETGSEGNRPPSFLPARRRAPSALAGAGMDCRRKPR